MNPRRLILGTYSVALAALGLIAGTWFVEAHAEYKQLKVREAAGEQKLANARRQLAEQERVLQRMRTDPGFVEKVVREQLKFARPGEIIFRYED